MSQPKLLTLRGTPLVHSTWQRVKAFVQHPPRLQTAAFCVVAGVAEALLYGNPPSVAMTCAVVLRNLFAAGCADILFSSLRYSLANPKKMNNYNFAFPEGPVYVVDPTPKEAAGEVDHDILMFAVSQSEKNRNGLFLAALGGFAAYSSLTDPSLQTVCQLLPVAAPLLLDNLYHRRFWDNIFAGKYRVIATPSRNEPQEAAATTSACSPS